MVREKVHLAVNTHTHTHTHIALQTTAQIRNSKLQSISDNIYGINLQKHTNVT